MAISCSHTETYWNPNFTMNEDLEWVGGIDERSSFKDIDTHRFKCTKCGEIGYYSNRARAYYEEGKPFWDDE